MKDFIRCVALVSVLTSPALAQQALVAAQSEIRFTSHQMGVPVEGRFRTFSASIRFDPKAPETSRVVFDIDLSSAAIGDAETMRELAKPAWFDSQRTPQAKFQSTSVKASGPGRFEVTGTLAIKGTEREVRVPVSLAPGANGSIASGSFVIKRRDFRVGDGVWADTALVADDVQVKFKLVLSGVSAF